MTQGALHLPGKDWPFAGLNFMGYGLIYADPPWRFQNYSEAGEEKNPVAHYDCMDYTDLADLPVRDLAAKDCWLVMWATAPLLDLGIELLGDWGFDFITAGAWAKESKTGSSVAFGTGYVRRSAAEFYLIGKHGEPRLKDGAASIRNLIWSPIREHSRKPDEMIAEIEASFDGPYVELFSRQRRPGWASWGNDVNRFAGEHDGSTNTTGTPITR